MLPSYYDSFLVLSRLCIRSSFLSIVGFFPRALLCLMGGLFVPFQVPFDAFTIILPTTILEQKANHKCRTVVDDHLNPLYRWLVTWYIYNNQTDLQICTTLHCRGRGILRKVKGRTGGSGGAL